MGREREHERWEGTGQRGAGRFWRVETWRERGKGRRRVSLRGEIGVAEEVGIEVVEDGLIVRKECGYIIIVVYPRLVISTCVCSEVVSEFRCARTKDNSCEAVDRRTRGRIEGDGLCIACSWERSDEEVAW